MKLLDLQETTVVLAQEVIVVMKIAAALMQVICAAPAVNHPAFMNPARPDPPETRSPISDLSRLAVWGHY